jgi:hypothetical protein
MVNFCQFGNVRQKRFVGPAVFKSDKNFSIHEFTNDK